MAKGIFREKSIQRISSPESLNQYIKVTGPGVWSVLIAIIILLLGVCVWGVFGHLDTQVDGVCVTQNGESVVYVKESDITDISKDLSVQIGKDNFSITDISANPVKISDEYIVHLFDSESAIWAYEIKIDAPLEDGTYNASIIIESVSPMSFVIN